VIAKAITENIIFFMCFFCVLFNFGPGGAFHDIPWVIKRYGIVPESAYKGLNYGSETHNHSEMSGMLKSMVEVLAKKPQGGKLTKSWKKAFTGVTDAYLGDLPDTMENFTFDYKGASYTPKTFAKHLDMNMDDYISLTSYTHHPFYQDFVIEVQDNWALQSCYNLPLDEFMEVMENAIMDGYTFAWGADISEKGFSSRDALAILPKDASTIRVKGKNNKHFSNAGEEKISNAFMTPVEEKIVTQAERQQAFDEQTTTDDHGMHITGIVKDQKGTKYFVVKNSWGDYNQCDGYFYASFPYVRYKTMTSNFLFSSFTFSIVPSKPLNGPSITFTVSPGVKGMAIFSSWMANSSTLPSILLTSDLRIGTGSPPFFSPKKPITPVIDLMT